MYQAVDCSSIPITTDKNIVDDEKDDNDNDDINDEKDDNDNDDINGVWVNYRVFVFNAVINHN